MYSSHFRLNKRFKNLARESSKAPLNLSELVPASTFGITIRIGFFGYACTITTRLKAMLPITLIT